jgi:hypothetical protein
MAGALGMDYLAVRLLESRDRAERAALSAVVVKAREMRRIVDLEQAARLWGGDDGGR